MGNKVLGYVSEFQKEFVESEVNFKIFCGTGCGKTTGLLLSTLPVINEKETTIGYFSKTREQLNFRYMMAVDFYKNLNVNIKEDKRNLTINFDSGAVLRFFHSKSDVAGKCFSRVLIDDGHQLSFDDFCRVLQKLRSSHVNYPLQILLTCTPYVDSWLFDFAEPFLDLDFKPIEKINAVHSILAYDRLQLDYQIIFSDIYDNKELQRVQPNYIDLLKALPFKERRRLLENTFV